MEQLERTVPTMSPLLPLLRGRVKTGRRRSQPTQGHVALGESLGQLGELLPQTVAVVGDQLEAGEGREGVGRVKSGQVRVILGEA